MSEKDAATTEFMNSLDNFEKLTSTSTFPNLVTKRGRNDNTLLPERY